MTKDFFYSKQKPDVFLNEFASQANALDAKRPGLFFGNRYKPLREAYVIGEFGKAIHANAVWLNRNDPPDAFFEHGGKEYSVEITEIYDRDQKRGDEYKKMEHKENENQIYEDLDHKYKILDYVAEIIDQTILKKKIKLSGNDVDFLLMYVDILVWANENKRHVFLEQFKSEDQFTCVFLWNRIVYWFSDHRFGERP